MSDNLFSKSEIKLFVEKIAKNYESSYTDFFISNKPLKIKEIKDLYDKIIFENDNNNDCGWLIFIDLCNVANWSHPCEYWFIINDNNILQSKNEQWFPYQKIKLEKIIIE